MRCGQPVGGLVVLDASFEDGVFFFVFLGELARRRRAAFRRRHIFRADGRVGELEAEIEVVGLELDGLGRAAAAASFR